MRLATCAFDADGLYDTAVTGARGDARNLSLTYDRLDSPAQLKNQTVGNAINSYSVPAWRPSLWELTAGHDRRCRSARMPVRRPPHIGQHVEVVFLGATVPGVIDGIDEQERRLLVLTEEGEEITFALSRATGQFVAEGSPTGARLVFHDPR